MSGSNCFSGNLVIAGRVLRGRLCLAPMAGITGRAFRAMAVGGGAALVVTEMVSADSIRYANRKSFKMLELSPEEHPAAVQIFGSDPGAMLEAGQAAVEAGADFVDINAGCPVKKIVKNGAGAALMADTARLRRIIYVLSSGLKVPVTVKFRTGLTESDIISPSLAAMAEEAGAAAVTVHGRPASRMHSGPVQTEGLRRTAAAVKIPVIGNGGVCSAAEADVMLSAGCSGVAIGRAAVANPNIFSEIKAGLSGLQPEPLSAAGRVRLFLRFLELNVKFQGEERGLSSARKLVGYWLKGLPGGASVRDNFMRLTSMKAAENLLIQYTQE